MVLEKCFKQIVAVRVQGPSTNAWAGTISFSTDAHKTYVAAQCTSCLHHDDHHHFSGPLMKDYISANDHHNHHTNTGTRLPQIVVGSDADDGNMASAACLNGKTCAIQIPDAMFQFMGKGLCTDRNGRHTHLHFSAATGSRAWCAAHCQGRAACVGYSYCMHRVCEGQCVLHGNTLLSSTDVASVTLPERIDTELKSRLWMAKPGTPPLNHAATPLSTYIIDVSYVAVSHPGTSVFFHTHTYRKILRMMRMMIKSFLA